MLFSVSASAKESNEKIVFFVEGKEAVYIYSLSLEEIKTLPNWSPGQGSEPVGVFEAATKVLEKYPGRDISALYIRLAKKIANGKEIWFYVFDVDYPRSEVVLMNGELIEPRKATKEEFYEMLRSR